MFCSSLRNRPEWTPAITLLAGSTPRFQGAATPTSSSCWRDSLTTAAESRLNTHDIALPLPQQQGRFFRLVLLSPKDVGTAVTEQRLERLFNLNGGRDAAVIFLLGPQGQEGNPMVVFMNLQINILNKLELPLIPLSSISALPSTLANLRTSLATTQPVASPAQTTFFSLLQHMASGNDPLSEHMTNLLSELGRSPREVAALAETEQGKARIMDLLGPVEGARVLSFLMQEKLAFV
ncbi:uncharacterized protein ColSpa_02047 [Colletotrichum spaethianum]|uniref:Uncharacterized protein n=1 Tax=Colletotrichum spaethianum TaxID=700344 RepID=A0AA37L514_9PEZI|nr:uncharacterized protein ColSpa_02047 [Colletotrichum spaethianum]GKT41866.1 hypothetical protein ColSpa_02047 [Colletotrichum spaethianum]